MAVDCFPFITKGSLILKPPKRSPLMLRTFLAIVLVCSVYMSSICFKQIKIHIRPELTRMKSINEQPYDPGWKQTEVKMKQALLTKKPIEEHSYGPNIEGLEHESQTEPESMKKEPIIGNLNQKESKIELETTGIKVVNLMQTELQIKPDVPRLKPLRKVVDLEHNGTQFNLKSIRMNHIEQHSDQHETKPELAITKAIERQEVGLKRAEIENKPGLMNIGATEQHSKDHAIVGLKQENEPMMPVSEKLRPVEQHSYGPTIVGSNQTKSLSNSELVRVQQLQLPCQNTGISESEMPYVHYPVPTNYSRRECACIPVRSYVIVTMQRSGSKWLESLLNSHTNVSSNGEVFYERERRANESIIGRTLDEVFNLDWRNSGRKKGCVAAVGFKWMLNQGILAHHELVSKYFAQRGVSMIFLFRRNLLRRWISLLANTVDHKTQNGGHKAHVFTQQEADQLASYKPILKPKSLVRKLRHAAASAQAAIDHFKSIRHIVLYYEDLVKNSTKLTDVMDFLRVPKRNLTSQHVKIHTKPLPELVRNWSAVQKALKGSHFESFLESDY